MAGRADFDSSDPALDASEREVTDPLISDSLLDGRYVIVRRLARGGMSVVYLAHHVGLGRPVALKILRPPPEVRHQYDFASWFKAEARTLAGFSHPNVVTLYDFGALGPGGFFLAMEYVDGPSLAELLRRGPLDAAATATYVRQVCKALRYAHQRGVVHCDVKPSNVLLSEDDEGRDLVKVIDFGIAEVERAGRHGADAPLLGSPHAMAPEQIEGEPVSPATDVYGVGVLLVRCLTGRTPFRGADTRATLALHVEAPIPTLAELAPGRTFPPALEAVVRRCLQKRPADRFQDMDQLIAALDAASPGVEDDPTGSLVLTPAERPVARPAARPAPVLLLAAAITALALVLAVAWALSSSGAGRADPVVVVQPAVSRPVAAPRAPLEPTVEAPPPAAAPAPARAPARSASRPVARPASKAASPPAADPPKEKAPDGYMDMPDFE